jgi:hypothetical protein
MLLRADLLFLAANLLHTADHQRQGLDGLSWEILAGGSALTIATIASLVLAYRRDERAPIFVVLLEIGSALVLAAVAVRELRRASSGAPRAAVVAGGGRTIG